VVADAKRTLERRRELHKKGAMSENEMDSAQASADQVLAQLKSAEAQEQAEGYLVASKEAALKMARAQVDYALEQVNQRDAALRQAQLDLEHTFILSPVDGIVIERAVDVGQTVAASLQAPKLFAIAQDLRKMQVETSVDEADIGRIQVDQRTTFTVDAFPGQEFAGRVKQIRKAPLTVQNVVTYTVVISAENPELRLFPGMTANVKIYVVERPAAVRVPNSALRFRLAEEEVSSNAREGGNPGRKEKAQHVSEDRETGPASRGRVWVVGREGKPMPLDVMTGISDGSFTEVVGGEVSAGQEVIIGINQEKKAPSKSGRLFF
jgi:HlyD family secretion protein